MMITVFEPGNAPFPGGCLACGSVQRRCIGFDVTKAWDGALLLCVGCLKHVLTDFEPEFFDAVAGQKYRALQQELEISKSRITAFEEELAKFRKAFTNAVDSFSTGLSADSVSSVNVRELVSVPSSLADLGSE